MTHVTISFICNPCRQYTGCLPSWTLMSNKQVVFSAKYFFSPGTQYTDCEVDHRLWSISMCSSGTLSTFTTCSCLHPPPRWRSLQRPTTDQNAGNKGPTTTSLMSPLHFWLRKGRKLPRTRNPEFWCVARQCPLGIVGKMHPWDLNNMISWTRPAMDNTSWHANKDWKNSTWFHPR